MSESVVLQDSGVGSLGGSQDAGDTEKDKIGSSLRGLAVNKSVRTWVGSLALLCGLSIQCCRELWCRMAAAALIPPPTWELPHAAALKKQKKKKKAVSYSVTYMWDLIQMTQKNLVIKQKQTHKFQNQSYGYFKWNRWGERIIGRVGIIYIHYW